MGGWPNIDKTYSSKYTSELLKKNKNKCLLSKVFVMVKLKSGLKPIEIIICLKQAIHVQTPS